MLTNFEFLGDEPMDNVITCLHFRIDEVVYFGYEEEIHHQEKSLRRFLTRYCNVQNVVFVRLPEDDLQSVLSIMRREIAGRQQPDSRIYFDITGGESLSLVAFGILSREFRTPMHLYDIETDTLKELDSDRSISISQNAPEQNVNLTIERYIELEGGAVNRSLHHDLKDAKDPEFREDVRKIWEIAQRNWRYWPALSKILGEDMNSGDSLFVFVQKQSLWSAIARTRSKLKSVEQLENMLRELVEAGILLDLECRKKTIRFHYKSEAVQRCLWNTGSILEIHTYLQECGRSDDCMIGVHLDWDGVIHYEGKGDVFNEIDVLSLNGKILTFISCKIGGMQAHKALFALYELDTVARRFGGKYAKKILVTAQPVSDIAAERAKEMGIEIRH